METQNDVLRSRRVHVIDVKSQSESYSTHNRNVQQLHRRRKRKHTKKQEEKKPIPLEIEPVIGAIIAYGRKTHALGTLKAASILTDIAEHLRKNGPLTPELEELMKDAEREAELIRTNLSEAYEDNAAQ